MLGSNSGTCKALAMKMADTAEQRGVNTEIHDLNAVAAGNLPTDRPVAIVTTSYEGQVSYSFLHCRRLSVLSAAV